MGPQQEVVDLRCRLNNSGFRCLLAGPEAPDDCVPPPRGKGRRRAPASLPPSERRMQRTSCRPEVSMRTRSSDLEMEGRRDAAICVERNPENQTPSCRRDIHDARAGSGPRRASCNARTMMADAGEVGSHQVWGESPFQICQEGHRRSRRFCLMGFSGFRPPFRETVRI